MMIKVRRRVACQSGREAWAVGLCFSDITLGGVLMIARIERKTDD